MLEKILLSEKICEILDKFKIVLSKDDLELIAKISFLDLQSFAKKDPSAHGDMIYILDSYLSFYAVLLHRIAHFIYESDKTKARQISEYAKLKSGVEIHPAANIGLNFVIDHGNSTVIGETCIIGNDCYILQNVILGGSKIAQNKEGQRHPVIGNNVEIAANVRIFGSVKIGNNVKISSNLVITSDVPNNTTLK